jgi:hypothetical protein
VAWVASAALPVVAHNGQQIVVYPAVAEPGTTIDVYGSFLWTDQPLEILLLAIDGTQWSLGASETDGNGSFSTVVTLPGGLPDATYGVLVRTPAGDDAHADVVIRSPFPATQVAVAVGAVAAVVLFVLAVVLRRRRRFTVDL